MKKKRELETLGLANECIFFLKGLYKYTYNRQEMSQFETIKLLKLFIQDLCHHYDFKYPLQELCEETNQVIFTRALHDLFYSTINKKENSQILTDDFQSFISENLAQYIHTIECTWGVDDGRFDFICRAYKEALN